MECCPLCSLSVAPYDRTASRIASFVTDRQKERLAGRNPKIHAHCASPVKNWESAVDRVIKLTPIPGRQSVRLSSLTA